MADNAESILEGRVILRPFSFERVEHLPCLNEDAGLIELLASAVLETAASFDQRQEAESERLAVG